ncbi:hypothetical protein GCM10025734_30190 [Kitasatospora paranensis]
MNADGGAPADHRPVAGEDTHAMVSVWEFLKGDRNNVDSGGQFKVTLTKSQPQHALVGAAATTGNLYVNLHWTTRTAERPGAGGALRKLFDLRNLRPMAPESYERAPVSVDLDLACMYELTDGSRGVVQPLGGSSATSTGRRTSSSAVTTCTGRRPARRCTSTWRRRTSSGGCSSSSTSTTTPRRSTGRTPR